MASVTLEMWRSPSTAESTTIPVRVGGIAVPMIQCNFLALPAEQFCNFLHSALWISCGINFGDKGVITYGIVILANCVTTLAARAFANPA
jgi:hypothetical protein